MKSNRNNWTTMWILVSILAFGTHQRANAQFVFGAPTDLGPPVSIGGRGEYGPSIQGDGLALYFTAAGGFGSNDLWVATRPSTSDNWSTPTVLDGTINSSANDTDVDIAENGLSLFFASRRAGTSGGHDMWWASRPTHLDPWTTPVNLNTVNSPFEDRAPRVSPDGLSLFFSRAIRDLVGSGDIYVSTRAATSDPWGEPEKLGANVNGAMDDVAPVISPDELSLFFTSNRDDPDWDIYVSTRSTPNAEWEPAVNIGDPVNTIGTVFTGDISADGSTLYFSSSTSPTAWSNYGLWSVPFALELAADFDADGDVDVDDFDTWQAGFGKTEGASHSDGDTDGDGDVDGGDFLVWQRESGMAASSSLLTSAVPEPASFVLLLALCGGALTRHLISRR